MTTADDGLEVVRMDWLTEAAKLIHQREERIAKMARIVGVKTARRVLELAERVGTEEGRASPVALTSERVEQYLDAVYEMALRGERMPETDAEMRAIQAAISWRADDALQIMGLR